VWKKYKKNITGKIKNLFRAGFEVKVFEQDTTWVIYVTCTDGNKMLEKFKRPRDKK